MNQSARNILKVMSLNLFSKNRENAPVAGGEPVDMRIHIRSPKVNDLLLGEGIDIAGLQEASVLWQQWLQNGLNSQYGCFGTCTANTHEGGYIIYLKDKFTPVEAGTFWLAPGAPSSPEKGWDAAYDRLCSWALFQIHQTKDYLLFLDAHLDHKGYTAQVEGAKLILEQIAALREKISTTYQIANCPVILTGDMNARPDTDTYAAFVTKLGDALLHAEQTEVAPSHDSSPNLYFRTNEDDIFKNGHRIDYIFFTEDTVRVKEYQMIHTTTNLGKYGPYITDHNAIIALVEF